MRADCRLSHRSAVRVGAPFIVRVRPTSDGSAPKRRLVNLQRARLGFEAHSLLTFQVAPPTAKYALNTTAPMFYRSLLDSVQALPGVRSAAVSSGIPFGGGYYTTTPMSTSGESVLPLDTAVPIDWRIVSPGYFWPMSGLRSPRARFPRCAPPASIPWLPCEANNHQERDR